MSGGVFTILSSTLGSTFFLFFPASVSLFMSSLSLQMMIIHGSEIY